MTPAAITGVGWATPPAVRQDDMWDGFFAGHFQSMPAARRLFDSAGVVTRHAAVDPRDEDLSSWGTEARMQRFAVESMPLGKQAIDRALAEAGLDAGDVGLFAVATCTGYGTPGIDIRLARDLGMGADVQRLLIGHMGCYAALPGLAAVSDFAVARGRPAVLLCLELTSLHLQPATRDIGQIVAHALFSDAAAAVVVQPGGGGAVGSLEVLDVVARTDASTAEHMTWDVTDLGFRMGLSPRVPHELARHLRPVVSGLLAAHGLTLSDVDSWAVHPGGPRILDVAERELELPMGALTHSRRILAEHGNCSSATALLVLDAVAKDVPPGGHVVLTAFGPGLTLYAALLRRRD